MSVPTPAVPVAAQRYLLIADVSGYTAFLNGVEEAHGVDFSLGIPAGYEALGALLDAVIEGVQPAFDIAKLEGDAVFAVAPAEGLDGQGEAVLHRLPAVYRAFYVVREDRKKSASDHICKACPVVGSLNLKMVLHRGQAVRQTVGSNPELFGPAVNIAHRLLKNSIQSRLGYRAYLFITDAATAGLGRGL
jgi:class 3 adenylate cyclase